ncbi:MAG: glycosyltransferase family 2 protein [Chloroflexota bacterium]|nr:glycosyltransferase family 2 protein [Chloroflexota bacterium]
MVLTALWLGVAGLAVPLSLLTLYLLVLTAAAIVARRSVVSAPGAGAWHRFAILVPAHNEEELIGRLLASLKELDYPSDLYEVCVVADNCDDATASIARSMGARVYERTDREHKAKGFALRWLLEQLHREQRTYDAFVMLDADSLVSTNFLSSMDARLTGGSQVIQAYYSVYNSGASAVAGLRFAALAAIHYVRPLGRSLFGLSCGLKGNGMCFAAPVVERFGWRWFTLAEDVEFHLALVRSGLRVQFAPEAIVQADMPVTLAQAASQNERWERGRLQLLSEYVPGLVLDGLRRRSLVQLDAAAEQLIPPLSVPFALSGVCLAASIALGAADLGVIAVLNLLGQMAYLVAGLVLVRAPVRTYVALSAAPVYIAWKLGLYVRAFLSRRTTSWVRTARVPSGPSAQA